MTASDSGDPRRSLPAVDQLLTEPEVERLVGLYGRHLVTVQARGLLAELRRSVAAKAMTGEDLRDGVAALPDRLADRLEAQAGARLRRVVNATGILLHTNLGRSPLPHQVVRDLTRLLDGYCDLEFDLVDGRRSDRNRRVESLLCQLTEAEAALVVNNNAGAMVLILAALARGRQVVVSRGELIEIGGSFRIPDMLAAAGAELVEVGTTNRTRLGDYERAVGPRTALLLKVFPSNYRMSGFVSDVPAVELVDLGRRRELPVVVDEGSGLLRPDERPPLRAHPSHRELLAAGCDLVCGSGDKLVGGPQAGLISGRSEAIVRCRKHPFYRALRPGRAVLAALEDVLRLHLTGKELPLDSLWPDPHEHRRRLERAAAETGGEIVDAEAFIGGGSAPEFAVPGQALGLEGDSRLLERLRRGSPPVVGYIRSERLILDLRTVHPTDDRDLIAAVVAAKANGAERSEGNA